MGIQFNFISFHRLYTRRCGNSHKMVQHLKCSTLKCCVGTILSNFKTKYVLYSMQEKDMYRDGHICLSVHLLVSIFQLMYCKQMLRKLDVCEYIAPENSIPDSYYIGAFVTLWSARSIRLPVHIKQLENSWRDFHVNWRLENFMANCGAILISI
jgi:hypothetical protein